MPTLCQFEELGDYCRCQICGRMVPRDRLPDQCCDKLVAGCYERPIDKPTVLQRAVKFADSLGRWIKAGRPTRDQEEIYRIFAICQRCEYYIGPDGTGRPTGCRACGCRVNTSTNGAFNKIAMQTESCPAQKW